MEHDIDLKPIGMQKIMWKEVRQVDECLKSMHLNSNNSEWVIMHIC